MVSCDFQLDNSLNILSIDFECIARSHTCFCSLQVSSLNDLLACDKAVPSEPLSWEVPGELADLFAIYMKSDPAPEKLSRLQYLLGISDSTAATLREMGDRVLQIGAEEEFVF